MLYPAELREQRYPPDRQLFTKVQDPLLAKFGRIRVYPVDSEQSHTQKPVIQIVCGLAQPLHGQGLGKQKVNVDHFERLRHGQGQIKSRNLLMGGISICFVLRSHKNRRALQPPRVKANDKESQSGHSMGVAL